MVLSVRIIEEFLFFSYIQYKGCLSLLRQGQGCNFIET